MNPERDPFADPALEDDALPSTADTRRDLFGRARLGFARIEKSFVQRDEYDAQTASRGSLLAELVTGRKMRALDLLLTIHALHPILDGSPLPLATWARLLSSESQPCSPRAVSAALRTLRDMRLLDFEGPAVRPIITLKREDGSDDPLPEKKAEGRGFFTIPFDYWTGGLIDELSLPAKAMLLIILRDTQDPNGKLTFTMPVARAQRWYGISERTAERGYLELSKKGLIEQRTQKVVDHHHPAGRREVVHRAPTGHYTTSYRERLRLAAREAVGAPADELKA